MILQDKGFIVHVIWVLILCFLFQLSILRKIKKDSTEPIGKNFRPIQATNGRIILATFAAPKYNSTVPANGVARIFDPSALNIIFCAFVSFALKNYFSSG